MQTITELVKMAGDCTYNPHYGSAETFCPSSNGDPVRDRNGRGPAPRSPNFEVIDGLLYRKKLERGFINYREVLKEDRRHEAVSTFHRRRSGPRHLSFEETYKCVAENYWWDGMYHHIRSHVLGCPECQRTQKPQRGGGSVTMTMASHGAEVLRRLQFQREAGLFCDITLRTEGRSFSAHRAVLAAASEYFQETLGEKEADARADVDLTGFSEQSLLPLLHFSYSSTLRVRPEDLPEVSAMARHLGMWPALEACSALLREQTAPPPAPRGLRTTPSAGAAPQGGARPHRKRERLSSPAAEEPTEDGGPRRAARRRPPGTPPQNGALHSPAHPRMKLIDFKSPSCKKACRPAPSTPPRPRLPPAASPLPSPPHTRLLRSTPGAAQEVLRLLPRPESPRRNKKAPPPPRRRPGPVRVKQEPPEEEEGEEGGEEGGEGGYERAQEKYRLMSVLGLQRTALLPRPQDLVGWRQKKRLRKLKANNYCLTKRRPPRAPGPGPAPARLLKAEPEDRPVAPPPRAPPSDRSMRSRGAAPAPPEPACGGGGGALRSSPRRAVSAPVRPPPAPPAAAVFRAIKAEPVDYFITGPPPPPHGRRDDVGPVAREDAAARAPLCNGRRPPAPGARPRHMAARRPPGRTAPPADGSPPGPPAGRPDGLEASGTPTTPAPPPPSLYSHPLYRVIKEEPADPLPVGGAFPEPAPPGPGPPDLGKRRSKPPIKLLDPGFLFSFCRPGGVPPGGLKREEDSVDICLTRSVSREQFAAAGPQPRVLRPRGAPPAAPPPLRVKRERVEKSVSQGGGPRARSQPPRSTTHHRGPPPRTTSTASHRARPARPRTASPRAGPAPPPRTPRDTPKTPVRALAGRRCILLGAARPSRLKPRPRPPPGLKDPRAAHCCLTCHTTYRDCLALVMHRLRHVEGKHWPCPLCSKNFFRLRNVRNHIRTHDQTLYKCRSCVAGS
ncbi:basic proline-rich protein [Gadus morhua]|uniref:basic proline-rich protein n=1 Tax=Gadus morhua TaxID=8049 RepID=UPI0011B439E9|nr:basic proline-rich protein-like [Gadus morhua]